MRSRSNFSQQVIDRARRRRDLREPRARARADLPRDGIVNFAQGEMAMFSTFVAWALWPGRARTGWRSACRCWPLVRRRRGDRARASSGRSRASPELDDPDRHARAVRPRQRARRLDLGYTDKASRARSPTAPSSRRRPMSLAGHRHDLRHARHRRRALLFFRITKLGLAMRAAAANPDASRLVGSRRADAGDRLGPGRAARRAGGHDAAPQLFLDVNIMGGVLVYSFAAATLGGIDSPRAR